MRHTLAILFALLPLAPAVEAQTWQAVVLQPAPGHTWTKGMGAGDGAAAGHGLRPGESFPAQARAVLFRGPTYLDITPAGFQGALVHDSFVRQTVGSGIPSGASAPHAILWRGVAPVDLHPSGYLASEALGVGGGYQVGFVSTGPRFAAVWQGSAASMQVLDSTGYGAPRAEGTDGTQHVGFGMPTGSSWRHALLWNGFVPPIDLNPPPTPSALTYVDSIATAVHAGQQVGYVRGGATVDEEHAALWLGSASTFRDLHPTGWARSFALSVRAGVQAGQGTHPMQIFQTRALAWQGDAASVQDLHALLPAQYQSGSSSAEDVNARGDIVGWVTLAGVSRPVLWIH